MSTKLRCGFLMSFVFIVLLGLSVRLFYLQVLHHRQFSRRANRYYTVVEQNFTPPRGRILDRCGEVLAENRHTYSVGVNPTHLRKSEKLISVLSSSLGMPRGEIMSALSSGKGFRWIKRHVNPKNVAALHDYESDGVVMARENHRIYPQAPLASDVIGIVGVDNQGLGGIEHSFESYLKGKPQKRKLIKDARGKTIYLDIDEARASRPETDIYLSLDSGLQYIAEREIKKGVKKFKARRAMAIVQQSNTGKILAMATYPSYDNSCMQPPPADTLKIKPVTNIFEPGSTFKIFTAAGALQEEVVELQEKFDCEGGVYTVGGFPIRDFEPHDMLSFREIILHSSNIGTAKTAKRLGKKLLYKYARDFGFGNFTGIRLPGEPRGILRKPDRWSGTSLSRISFGQEVGVTAIQLASAISAVANGGVLYEPQIIEKIMMPDNAIEFKPLAIRRVISEETAKNLNEVLIDVVSEGSGVNAAVKGYPVAGKTGTAQKFDPETFTYAEDEFIALFGGYIPAGDSQLTIVVIFEEPEGPFHWGGYVAAPVFSKIARAAVNYLDIPPPHAIKMAQR